VCDLIIRGGLVADGLGNPLKRADVGLSGDRIARIGDLSGVACGREIDASGKVVAPGFVDLHTHADLYMPMADREELLKPLVMQGITSVVGGNCGYSNCSIPGAARADIIGQLEGLAGPGAGAAFSWDKPGAFMEALERGGMTCNMGALAGHGTLRIAAAGLAARPLRDEEQRRMEGYLEECLDAGCLGLSAGLQYFPGLESDAAELRGLGRALKGYGGVFAAHLRSYAHTLGEAIDEVCCVGADCGVRTEISHLYYQPYVPGLSGLSGRAIRLASFLYNRAGLRLPVEGVLRPWLEYLEGKRRSGIDVGFDVVPSSQGFTELSAFLPPYVFAGGKRLALERLADPAFRRRVAADIAGAKPAWPHREGATWSFNYILMTGWGGLRVMAVDSEKNRWMEGLSFPEIGDETGKAAFDALADLLVEEEGRVLVFHTPTHPDDPFAFRSMWLAFTDPHSAPTTDALIFPFGRPSHVLYDCFPRFIEFFVKRRKLLSLEEAIRKSTSLPAHVMNISRRGELREGYYADIVVLDAEALSTKADFFEPRVHPRGIEQVLINGAATVRDGAFVPGALPGRMIRRGE
jgi:N-acyl-D-amino-acid deacylase